MATYLINESIKLTRQEGDTADLSFIISGLDISTYDIYFGVFDRHGVKIIDKKLSDWVKDGQTITTAFSESDTKGKNGNNYHWELEFSSTTSNITWARGLFIITKELLTDIRH